MILFVILIEKKIENFFLKIYMAHSPTSCQLEALAKQLIPLSEAAAIAHRTRRQLSRLIRSGHLWGVKIGPNWVTTEPAVRDYLAMNPHSGPKPKTPNNTQRKK